MTLLGDAFFLEYRVCGELEGEVTDGEPSWVFMACSCGGHLARRILSGVPPEGGYQPGPSLDR